MRADASSLAPADFAGVNPNTGTAPVFRTRRDAEITRHLYERHPVLVDRSANPPKIAWPVRHHTMFHMANDSHHFRTAAQLNAQGFYPVRHNCWKRGNDLYSPLFEGKMVQAFDHRAASIVVNPKNINRPAQPRQATFAEHADQYWLPKPQFWVPTPYPHWYIGYKMITAPTNRRTFIATFVPPSGAGHSMDILLPTEGYQDDFRLIAPALLANVNSFPFDFRVTNRNYRAKTSAGISSNSSLSSYMTITTANSVKPPLGPLSATTCCASRTLPTTWSPWHGTLVTRGLHSPGTREERRHLRARLGRALLPPLRLIPNRCCLRTGHIPDSPPGRRSRGSAITARVTSY